MVKKLFLLTLVISCLIFNISSISASVVYIVKPGDTLSEIAQKYGLNYTDVAQNNGVADLNKIVPGLAIVLEGSQYIVEEGDSLWAIANRNQVSLSSLINLNQLEDYIIFPGQKLTIPSKKRINAMIGAFAYPNDIVNGISKHKYSFLTHVAAFEFHPNNQGILNELPQMHQFKEIMWTNNIVPYATVTNLSSKGFDHKLARLIMESPEKRQTLISNIYNVLRAYDLKGVVIDFEGLKPDDRIIFNQFINQLAEKIHPHGMELSIAVPPLQGDQYPSWNSGYDYYTLGKHADYIFIMTYDWHWLGGSAGPISPIKRVRDTLIYSTSVIPKEKIVMGIPLYAYDWPVNGQGKAQAYSQQYAVKQAIDHGSTIYYDYKSASPWFRYTDNKGITHEVWFEDARSILAKYQLVKEFGIRGVGGWQLKFNFPQAEILLKEQFN